MGRLLLLLTERASIIILLAYILMNTNFLKKMMLSRQRKWALFGLVLLFSFFAILSNLTGIPVGTDAIGEEVFMSPLASTASLVNTRVLTIGVAGLVGGPVVGTLVGVISGAFRFFQGGIDPHIYFISSILVGLISGIYGYEPLKNDTFPSSQKAAVVGALGELTQMACILFLSSQNSDPWQLVKLISLPMIGINSIGSAIFLSIINSSLIKEQWTRAVQTHEVMELTKKTFPLFHQGLTESSAQEAARLIKETMKVSAVSITNQEKILAYIGAGDDHHTKGMPISTDLSHVCIRTGETKIAHTHEEIGCGMKGCPLNAAIVIPLKDTRETIGTIKFYFTNEKSLTDVERQWAEGLTDIFTTQIRLGEVEAQKQLLQKAELQSLQAQINPHFFFNAINTISAIMRFDPTEARRLLLHLSQYFRANLTGNRQTLIRLDEELAHVLAYLEIENARFPDRVEVIQDVEDGLEHILIPPFLIQVLVENAIKHAFKQREKGNKVLITVRSVVAGIEVAVVDNGYGIDSTLVGQLGQAPVDSASGSGTALDNLNRRLAGIFGQKSQLYIFSNENGSSFSCWIPENKKEDVVSENLNRG